MPDGFPFSKGEIFFNSGDKPVTIDDELLDQIENSAGLFLAHSAPPVKKVPILPYRNF